MTLLQVDNLPPPTAELMHRWEKEWSDWMAQHNPDSLRRILRPPPRPDDRVMGELKIRNVPERVLRFVGRNEANELNAQMDANWRSYCRASPFRAAAHFGSRRYPIEPSQALATADILPETVPQDFAVLADLDRRCDIAVAHNKLLMELLFEPPDKVGGEATAAQYPYRVAEELKASLAATASTYSIFLSSSGLEGDGAEVARFVWARILVRTAAEVRPCLHTVGFPAPTLVLRNTADYCAVWRITRPISRQDAFRLNARFGAAEHYDDAIGQPLGIRYFHVVPLLEGAVYADRTSALTLWQCCNSAIERRIGARFGG